MTNIKGETKGILEDVHCLRRSLGKLWDIQPGRVISKLCEGVNTLKKHGGKLKTESDNAWYGNIQHRPDHWHNMVQNVQSHCIREEWGGDDEIQLWAYITQTTIVVTNKVRYRYTIYNSNSNVHEMPTMKQNNTLQEMHDQLTQVGREPAYLIYSGVHYNPIVHERQGASVERKYAGMGSPTPKNGREWHKHKRKQGRAAKRTKPITGERMKQRENEKSKTMIQTVENDHKKRKQSENKGDLNAQEYKSRKKKRETQTTEQ